MWDCAVIGCPNGRFNAQKSLSRVSFHVFPHPVREANRFRRWLSIINNPRLLRMTPMNVFKSARICRRHFGSDCFNGECRNLLPIAIPTLNLPEVRPVALVQPMDAVGDELERILREERRQQLKRHGAIETPFDDEINESGKRSRIGITLLSSDVEEAECSTGDRFIDRIIEFDVKQEDYDETSLASDLRLSTVCGENYGLSCFTGLVMSRSADLDTLKQVEILNEPPETLLNDSPAPADQSTHVPIEKGYEQLVREFASEASNDEQEQQIQRNAECLNQHDDKSLTPQDDTKKRNSARRFLKGTYVFRIFLDQVAS
uniref:THAP-type domain-containing protein n=1 Tax=Anopheles maculatus TaxID=74869 RepID=A0A182T1P7_9DIPT